MYNENFKRKKINGKEEYVYVYMSMYVREENVWMAMMQGKKEKKKKTIKRERSWLVVIVKATNCVTELEKY